MDVQTMRIRRSTVFEDSMQIYKSIDVQRPLMVTFAGEEELDQDRMTREFFSAFWDAAIARCFVGRDCMIPRIHLRNTAKDIFPLLGKILSHMFILLGTFPVQLCQTCICYITNPDCDVDEDVLLKDFINFLPRGDGHLIQRCMASTSWPAAENRRLIRLFSINQMSVIPTNANLRQLVLNLAQIQLLDKCAGLLNLMRKGIPSGARSKLAEVSFNRIRSIYEQDVCSGEEVAELMEIFYENTDFPRHELIVFGYLTNCIREMSVNQVSKFLWWLTGTPTKPKELKVMFNWSLGLARVPIAHTCSNLLEVSTAYVSYEDFKNDLFAVINSVEAYSISFV